MVDNPLYANNGYFENPLYEMDHNAAVLTEEEVMNGADWRGLDPVIPGAGADADIADPMYDQGYPFSNPLFEPLAADSLDQNLDNYGAMD
jgi:hypothetical protein